MCIFIMYILVHTHTGYVLKICTCILYIFILYIKIFHIEILYNIFFLNIYMHVCVFIYIYIINIHSTHHTRILCKQKRFVLRCHFVYKMLF